MKNTKKLSRLLVLYTGGTIGMELQEDDSKDASSYLAIPHLSPQSLKKRLQDRVPELQKLAHCDFDILLNRDSAHIGPDEWLLIAKQIQKNWEKYDGIVLLHGTDTLAYTASALSFLLRPCKIPIVLTGAQRPLSALRTDARMNLISAVEIAASGPHEIVNQVTVFFGDKLFQGNRVRKKSASDFTAFESPFAPPLATVGTTIRYSEFMAPIIDRKPLLKSHFSHQVLVIHVTPAFPAKFISSQTLEHLDALILVIFHSGTAPTHSPSFLHLLRKAKQQRIPIILATEGSSQPPNSEILKLNYEAGKNLLKEGCLWAGSMTLESAYVKACLLCAQTQNIRKFTQLWKQNLAGEGI